MKKLIDTYIYGSILHNRVFKDLKKKKTHMNNGVILFFFIGLLNIGIHPLYIEKAESWFMRLICTPDFAQADASICIQYCKFMSLCQVPLGAIVATNETHFNFIERRVKTQVDFDDVMLVCIESVRYNAPRVLFDAVHQFFTRLIELFRSIIVFKRYSLSSIILDL